MADDHIEPLTGTPLRGKGRLRDFSPARDPRAVVTILNQAYPSPSCQQSIYELCDLLVDSKAFQVVLVEGDRGPIAPGYGSEWGSNIVEWVDSHATVSPGVLELLAKRGAAVSVLGVDDPTLTKEHHDVQRICRNRKKDWENLAQEFRGALAQAKEAVGYTEDMRWISERLFAHRDDPLPLGDRARGLVRIGAPLGVESDDYPTLMELIEALDHEQALDFAQVERERSEYVRVLVDSLGSWWKGADGKVVVDRRVLPPLGFWMSKTGRSNGDLEREVAAEGVEAVLSRCDRWLLEFLVDGAFKYRGGLLSHGAYYGDVVALGLRLGVDVFQFSGLRRYVQYVEASGRVAAGRMGVEIEAYAEETMAAVLQTPAQREVYQAEKTAHLLTRAGLTQLTPSLADNFYEDTDWEGVRDAIATVSRSAGRIRLPHWVEEVTRAAYRFCRISAARSHIMTEETIRQVSLPGVNGGILVCGGFHTDGISRLLSARYRDVGWSAILPQMDISDARGSA